MDFLIVLLTAVIILDCLLLILLVLMQLPKKEAGAGLAFGAAATDALFGAGSGNFLTKATKYAAILFFGLAIVLSLLENHRAHAPGSRFRQSLNQPLSPPAGTPVQTPVVTPPVGETNFQIFVPPTAAAQSNAAPAAPAVVAPSNAAPVPPK